MWSIERHHLAVDLLCARKFAPPLLQLLPGIRFVQTIYVKRLNDGCIAILEQGAELVHLVGADGRRGNVDGEVAALLGRLKAEPAFRGRGVHDVVIETVAGGPGLRAVRSRGGALCVDQEKYTSQVFTMAKMVELGSAPLASSNLFASAAVSAGAPPSIPARAWGTARLAARRCGGGPGGDLRVARERQRAEGAPEPRPL